MAIEQRCTEGPYLTAGISLESAELFANLFNGPHAIMNPPRPCTISGLQVLYTRYAHLPAAWEPLCAVWDTALVSCLPAH